MKITKGEWKNFCNQISEENFIPIYEKSRALVYTICYRILQKPEDVSDAFQSAYARLIALARNTEEASKIQDADKIIKIFAVREASNLLKRRTRRSKKEYVSGEVDYLFEHGKTQAEEIEEKEQRAIIKSLINQLPDRYRIPVVLHYFQGMTHREIAESLGRSRPAVSMRISTGLKKLKPMFKKAGLGPAPLTLAGLTGGLGLLEPPFTASASEVFTNALHSSELLSSAEIAFSGKIHFLDILTEAVLKYKVMLVPAGILTLGFLAVQPAILKSRPKQFGENAPVRKSIKNDESGEIDSLRLLHTTPDQEKFPAQSSENNKGKNRNRKIVLTSAEKALQRDSKKDLLLESEIFTEDIPTTGARLIVSGKVSLEDGSPAGNTEMILNRMMSGTAGFEYVKIGETETGKAGFYKIIALYDMGEENHYLFRLEARREGNSAVNVYIQFNVRNDGDLKENRIREVKKDVILPDASYVRGIVINEQKEPIPDVTVYGISTTRLSPPELAKEGCIESSSLTDQEGRFNMDDMASGKVILNIDEKGYVYAKKEVVAPVDNIQIILSSGGASVEGRVFGFSSGEAVNDAGVSLSLSNKTIENRSFQSRITRTDETGYFKIENMIEGTYRIFVFGKDIYPVPGKGPDSYKINLSENESRTGLEFFVYEGHTVRGQVLDSQTREPVKDARVWMLVGMSREDFIMKTGPDGWFEFHHVPPYAAGIGVKKDGYVVDSGDDYRDYIDLNLDMDNLEITKIIEMVSQVTVSGKVISEDGESVSDAEVMLYSQFGDRRNRKNYNVDQNGNFTLPAKPSTEYRIKASAPGFPPSFSKIIDVGDNSVEGVKIILKKGGSLHGVVIDEKGNHMQRALVKTIMQYRFQPYISSETIAETLTDQSGRFHFDNLPRGEIIVTAEKKGFTSSREHRVEISPEKEPDDLEIVLRVSSFIEGTVVDGDGNPIVNVMVDAHSHYSKDNSRGWDQTDAEGHFRIEGLVNLPHKIDLSHPEHGSEMYDDMEVNRDDVTLVMGTKARITLDAKVVDDSTGEPVDDFTVKCGVFQDLITRTPGGFKVEKLVPNCKYQFTIQSPLYSDLVEFVEASEEDEIIEKTFRLNSGGSIVGRVIDKETGAPLSDVRIYISAMADEYGNKSEIASRSNYFTEEDGFFNLECVAAGNNVMEIIPPDPFVKQTRTVVVHAGKKSDMRDVEIGKGGQIEGRLMMMPGENPLPEHPVILTSILSDEKRGITDKNGRFSFSGLPNDHYTLKSPDFKVEQWIDLDHDENKEVDLLIGTGSLKAKVMKDHAPFKGIVRLKNKNWIEIHTNEQGEFELNNLAPGTWSVEIRKLYDVELETTIEIKPGEQKQVTFEIPGDATDHL